MKKVELDYCLDWAMELAFSWNPEIELINPHMKPGQGRDLSSLPISSVIPGGKHESLPFLVLGMAFAIQDMGTPQRIAATTFSTGTDHRVEFQWDGPPASEEAILGLTTKFRQGLESAGRPTDEIQQLGWYANQLRGELVLERISGQEFTMRSAFTFSEQNSV